MVEKENEADDPYEFVAVRFPVEEGVDQDERMARVFVEEYALLGVPRHRILQLFRSEHFAGTNAIYVNRGQAFVEAIIADIYGPLPQEVA
ncbi:MAG TPA: hypothetical protein PKA49_01445 [Tepidiformaceae bacterium]|jgi:hypothetical protein|nr:hypothetical protein [Thermoflexaceae bacterium]HMS57488.1 hypothetical protein [Tepidiformaceae bacterium]